MYLKSIEIFGFKSFANKSKLELNPGVTAIVGPNGCGKSNVVDAIKWCIGEMSRKSLRMPSMMDVIFAGTTKRQPLNMAEVTLTFDNEERKLNFDFSEVSVTRKIYRSEESEYFINKTPCRLKDIKDMFLDTGIGSDGYAIISQGSIDALLNCDALGRRDFFEEVAGVSKYKAKREESLKRLERLDADLSVLENSLEIINEQIKKLDSEVKKAKLQQKYKEELKEAELSYIVKEISEHNLKIEQKNKELSPVLNEINEVNATLTAQQAELSTLNINLSEMTEEEKNVLEKFSTVKSEMTKLEQRIINNGNLIEEKKKQISEIEKEENKNLEYSQKAEPELENIKKQISELLSSYEKIKQDYEKAREDYSLHEQKLNQINLEIEKKEKDIYIVYDQEKKISSTLSALESSLSHYKNDELTIKKEQETLNAKLSENSAVLNSKKNNYSELKAKIEEYESKISGLEKDLEQKNNRKKEIEKLLLDNNSRLSYLKSKLENSILAAEKDSYWRGANFILDSKMEGVLSTLRHLLSYPKEYKTLIEDSLGVFLDSIVVNNEQTALKAIEMVNGIGGARARFIILDKIPQLELYSEYGQDSLFSVIKASEEIKPLLNYLLKGVKYKDKAVWGDFWISGGDKEITTNENYWGEVDELKQEIDELSKKSNELLNEEEALLKAISSLEQELYSLKESLTTLKIEFSSLENEIKSKEEDIKMIESNLKSIGKGLESNLAIQKETLEKIDMHKTELENIKNNAENLKKAASDLKKEREGISAVILNLKESVASKSKEFEYYAARKDNLTRELEKSNQLFLNITRVKEELKVKKEFNIKEIEKLDSEIKDYKVKDLEERNNLKELELKKADIAEKITELKTNIDRLSHLIKENSEILNELNGKRGGLDIELNTIKTRLEDVLLKLKNDYQVSFEEIKEKYANAEVDIERINFLKRRLENMGPVNMTAPEEYEALVNRYNTMHSQVEDLNKAKNDLKAAINRINDATRENFKNTFDKVQHYFKNIYSVLFNGGEANLILTNPDNLLETGVEIMAHPPGKRLINVSQLSGGEKSLTAIALLFSFFKVNPSPFCVMDEIDAALDEGNVERFARMIKEFSSETQFIIITHNKRTMEVADIMYGVTMEELGISKIISVDLRRAVDMASSAQVAKV